MMSYETDAGMPAPATTGAGAHACPNCPKSFARLCDLNKHAKSHTRPYKCKEPGCKYNTRGWPTAKELERHYNDKHSATPRTFRCLFPPCPYWSKRESNCKQHMEKAHDWNYVRSKSKGKRTAPQTKDALDEDATTSGNNASVEPTSPDSHQLPEDFVLYDGEADAIGEDDTSYYYSEPHHTPAPYVPWTSPATRMRKNETLLEVLTHYMKPAQGHQDPQTGAEGGDIDPALSAYGFHGAGQYAQPGLCGQSAQVSVKVESPVLSFDNYVPASTKYEAMDDTFVAPKQDPGSTSPDMKGAGYGGAPHPYMVHGPSKRAESGGAEECWSSKKRLKPNPAEDFTDTSMPDIFRYAHPEIYDKSRNDRYSPCHTVHREISTLVRHLSRPAHRLKVTERYISSFDIEDPNFQHPRVGVCRTCWQSFHDRSTFESHVALPCQKVSKGKREKWRVLYESFTPLSDSTHNDAYGADLASTEMDLCEPEHQVAQNADCITPTTQAALTVPGLVNGLQEGAVRLVPADELARVEKEREALRQQLQRMAEALRIRQMFRENLKTPQSDQDGLLQHMGSQPTDVDVLAFMSEMDKVGPSAVTTSSLPTIHRVPPSPPTQLSNYPDVPGSNHASSHGFVQAKAAPLPSIADSGYGTEQRRGSLGTIMLGKEQNVTMVDAAATTEGPLNSLPSSHAPAPVEGERKEVGPLSLEHGGSQPGFYADQDIDYADPSYGIFYQDQIRPSTHGFPFETSQTD